MSPQMGHANCFFLIIHGPYVELQFGFLESSTELLGYAVARLSSKAIHPQALHLRDYAVYRRYEQTTFAFI